MYKRQVNREDELSLKVRAKTEPVKKVLSGIKGIVSSSYSESNGITSVELKTAKRSDIRDDIFFAFAERRMPVIEMVYRVLTLEDIFLALTDDKGYTENNSDRVGDKATKPRMHLFSRLKNEEKTPEDDYTPQFGQSSPSGSSDPLESENKEDDDQ